MNGADLTCRGKSKRVTGLFLSAA